MKIEKHNTENIHVSGCGTLKAVALSRHFMNLFIYLANINVPKRSRAEEKALIEGDWEFSEFSEYSYRQNKYPRRKQETKKR